MRGTRIRGLMQAMLRVGVIGFGGGNALIPVMEKEFGLTTQLLHAYKLIFEPESAGGGFPETVESTLPPDFERIKQTIFGNNTR